MKKGKEKDLNILTPDQEAMRLQVVDLELKARYWKAQHGIRFYTLESEKLQDNYNAFLEASSAALQKAIEEAKVRAEAAKAVSEVEKENKPVEVVPNA